MKTYIQESNEKREEIISEYKHKKVEQLGPTERDIQDWKRKGNDLSLLKEGWEISPDRIKAFEKIVNTYNVGNPILTSKCLREGASGFLIVGNIGIAWKNTQSGVITAADALIGTGATVGKISKWTSWQDVVKFTMLTRRKNPDGIPGSIKLEVNKRKGGVILKNKRGVPKTEVWRLFLRRNKNETKSHYEERKAEFYGILKELYHQYKTDANPSS